MTNTSALSVSDGNFRLVVGNDLDVSAEEISAAGRTVRFGPRELVALARLVGEAGIGKASTHGLLVISDDLNPEAGGGVHVSAGGGELGGLLRAASEEKLAVVLTEAVARGWFHTLSLAGSGPLAWTREDSEHIGHLGIQGRPLLSEYLAERRRAVRGGGYSAQAPAAIPADDESAREVLCSLLEESGSRTQFGAAELAVAGDGELRTIVRAATAEGEWLDNLRLALAAEEALAADLLLEVLAAMRHKTGPLERWTRLRAAIAARVLACRGRIPIFEEVLDRLERAPESVWDQVFRRGKVKSTRYVGEDVAAYLNTFTEPEGDGAPDAAAAKRLLEELRAAAGGDGPGDGQGKSLVWVDPADLGSGQTAGSDDRPTLEDLARALGGQFARRVPAVEEMLRGQRELYPDEDDESLTARLRRATLAQLDLVDVTEEDSRETVSEIVMDHVLALSMLRGVPVATETDLEKLGARLLTAAGWTIAMRRSAESAGAAAGVVVEYGLPLVQEVVVEFLFHQMTKVKPAKPGTYRNAYKFARSKLGRARRDPRVRDAAAGGAMAGMRMTLDRVPNRLLLWSIDREIGKAGR
ncbi:hypothetical protein [Corynebacterium halotolerans]|uniref:Uncharacterized protein n=1 Tax=Corynebacterium halotolerans YIM 70093 = DSM 44683 TaxID=1121362 RepID=M1NU72_9CORY|nr:hypothetical protein [Corynebacterium halotolerans]AGF73017.1 hypothetical protein A605_10075 [Corynebacterium halotolerans YIM 70093 = DSM 44683]